MKCTVIHKRYPRARLQGQQVRDNIHSHDLVEAFWQFFRKPRIGEVYNIGGSRFSNCSCLRGLTFARKSPERNWSGATVEENRIGDHIWWISDVRRFQSHYPDWKYCYDVAAILEEIHRTIIDGW